MGAFIDECLLEVAPPPFDAPGLDGGKPPTKRVERYDHRQPHCIDAGEAEPIAGRLAGGHEDCIANRCPGKQNCERVEHVEVHDVVEERHAPEGCDPVSDGSTPSNAASRISAGPSVIAR